MNEKTDVHIVNYIDVKNPAIHSQTESRPKTFMLCDWFAGVYT